MTTQSFGGNIQFSDPVSGNAIRVAGTPTTSSGIIPQVIGYLSAPGTNNNTTAAQTDLLAGGTAVPALSTLSGHVGFSIAPNVLTAGKYLRLKCFGTYTTNGATATITPSLLFNTAAASVVIATGEASGTFATAAGPFSWSLEVIIYMLSATNVVTSGSMLLGGANPATTVSGNPGINSVAAGVAIVGTSAGNICPTWTGSSNNAANTFQCLGGTLEILN